MKNTTNSRVFALDLLRVLACYMVIQVHAGEFYYIGEGGAVLNGDDSFWVNVYNSLCRTSVPLFVLISGYFILPVKDKMSIFFKKRLTRVVIPFILWCCLYAWYYYFRGQTESIDVVFANMLKTFVNYGVEVGHLWYIYMLVGLYLFFPIISPWLEKASRSSLHFYIVIWAVSTCLPYIHLLFPQIWGECFWNPTPMLYYFSGFLGFAILGFYFRKFCSEKTKWDLPLGVLLIILGYAITFIMFNQRLQTEEWVWTLEEACWGFSSINVMLMLSGLFLLFKNIKSPSNRFINSIFTDISNKSYGMYLVHIMVLNLFHYLFNDLFDSASIKIPLIAIPTFIVSYFVVKLLSYLPKSKYIIG